MLGHEIQVRPATTEDAATLARLLRDFNTEFDTEIEPLPVVTDRFARILTHDAVLALLATDGAAATGFALVSLRPVVWFDGPVATLDELYVVPGLRDRGIGTALLTAARELVRDRGCPEMHINVDEDDEDTRRFYETHGFVNIEPATGYRMLLYVGPTRRGDGRG